MNDKGGNLIAMSVYFDDNHSLVNLSNSILGYFGVEKLHESDDIVDKALSNQQGKKVVCILLDGFGRAIQEAYHEDCPFILSHVLEPISSVFPPTTAAATTSFLDGLYPNETGWIGWTEKFDMYSWPIVMFFDCYDDESQFPVSVSSRELCPYKTIISMMREIGIRSDLIQSFANKNDDIPQFFTRVEKLMEKNDFVYAYHCSPDSELHEFGVGDRNIRLLIRQFDHEIERLVKKYPDTIFLVFADHGHKNAFYFDISEHDDFYNCLKMPTYSIEARTASFDVFETKTEEFGYLANKYYGEHFDVYTKKQVIENHLFGYGKDCSRFLEVLGDYLLVSKDGAAFTRPGGHMLASTHAGSTIEEREINLSIFNAG